MKKYLDILIRLGFTLQVTKTALAAAVSWWVATLLSQNQYPYFAPLAAILTLQVTVADSLKKASYRITGIILGVVVTVLISHWHTFEISVGTIFMLVLIAMTIPTAMHLNPQIISQVGVSALLVFAFGQHQGYAAGRIIETIIGSGIAIIINAFLFPANTMPAAEQSILVLSQLSSSVLKSSVTLLKATTEKTHTERNNIRDLVKETERCIQTVQLTQQSLKYSPFLMKVRIRLTHITLGMNQLEDVTIQVRDVYRGLFDLRSAKEFQNEYAHIEGVKPAIESTASCIAYFGKVIIESSKESLSTLMTNIEGARSIQSRCLSDIRNVESLPILRDLGGILTDLSRILRELEEAALALTKNNG
ncbi:MULTISPECIES: FUSC family protein [Bacillaceae]|uniref:FUSC family protein n=1 Tax=Bacillaceae TaxID=186817 RepID=UPI00101D66A1|nr:aromatic acid exporter family protein [Ectobacillus funiculus]